MRRVLSVLVMLSLLVATVASAQVSSFPVTTAVTVLSGAGAPSAGAWRKGDLTLDTSGVLRICTVAGTPGTWVVVVGGSTSDTGTTSNAYTFNSDATMTTVENVTVTFKAGDGFVLSTLTALLNPTTDVFSLSLPGGSFLLGQNVATNGNLVTVNADATGVAPEAAGVALLTSTMGSVATMRLQASVAGTAGLAYWIDDVAGAEMAPTFIVGKPGDFSDVSDNVGATILLRGHLNGDAVDTANEGTIALGTDERLTLAATEGVYAGGVLLKSGLVDGVNVGALSGALINTSCAAADTFWGCTADDTVDIRSAAQVKTSLGLDSTAVYMPAAVAVDGTMDTVTSAAAAYDPTNRGTFRRLTAGDNNKTGQQVWVWRVPPDFAGWSTVSLAVGNIWSDATGNNAGVLTVIDTAGATIVSQVITASASYQTTQIAAAALSGGTWDVGGAVTIRVDVTLDNADTVDVYDLRIGHAR